MCVKHIPSQFAICLKSLLDQHEAFHLYREEWAALRVSRLAMSQARFFGNAPSPQLLHKKSPLTIVRYFSNALGTWLVASGMR